METKRRIQVKLKYFMATIAIVIGLAMSLYPSLSLAGEREGLDKACITEAIEYMDHPVVIQSQLDTMFAGLQSVEQYISKSEIDSIVEEMTDRIRYVTVTAMCSVLSVEEVKYMNILLQDKRYLTMLSKQPKMFMMAMVDLTPDIMALQRKLQSAIVASLEK